VEDLSWATHPQDAAGLQEALDASERGDEEPVEDALIQAARLRRAGPRPRVVV